MLAFAAALAAATAAAPRRAEAASPEEQAAVAAARRGGLAAERQWHRLVLYRRGLAGRWTSQAHAPRFFLSPQGAQDPAAELEATLEAFFAPVPPEGEDAHALCRFPARRAWLEERLGLGGTLPAVRCPALARHLADVHPDRVSLVYAASYLENPASALGHTFLRLRNAREDGSPAAEDRRELGPGGGAPSDDARDVGVDYTARADTKNPLFYAFKGVAGLFAGVYRQVPYDEMLREYAGASARDLWEYELRLSAREAKLLGLHLFEMRRAGLSYLYFTDNCSYQMLAAIEAAAPRVDLLSRIKPIVLPPDTVKIVVGAGLVRSVVYRPSVRSVFRDALIRRSPEERALVAALVDDPDAPLPAAMGPEARARVLDTATLAVDARDAPALVAGEGAALARRRRLASRRDASAGGPYERPPLSAPPLEAPERAHDSMRLTLGTGSTTRDRDAFGTLGFRMALRDLADPPAGSPELSQLQFMDTRLRYSVTRRSFTLDSLTFAELMAIHPLRAFEQRLSWRARAFGVRARDRACVDCFVHGPNVAVGAAVGTDDERLVLFAMADAHAAFGSGLDGIAGSNVRVGVGPYAGLRARLVGDTVAVVTASVSWLPAQPLPVTHDVRGALRAPLARNVALGLEAVVQPLSAELQLASYFYF
jgi:hypothetical protein